jgi:hypothetical protein
MYLSKLEKSLFIAKGFMTLFPPREDTQLFKRLEFTNSLQ